MSKKITVRYNVGGKLIPISLYIFSGLLKDIPLGLRSHKS